MVGVVLNRGFDYGRLYSTSLGAAYRTGVQLYDPDFALMRDPEIWDKVQRDAVIKMAIEQRLHAVAGVERRVDPGRRNPDEADELASFVVQEAMDLVRNFRRMSRHLAKAAFHGNAWQVVRGERRWISLGGTKKQAWWVPTSLIEIDKRRFRIVPVRGEDGYPDSRAIQLHEMNTGQYKTLGPDAPVVHLVYDDEEVRLGHGRGLLEAIYHYHWAKAITLEEGLAGIEKWARGLVSYGVDRNGKSPLSNAETATQALDIVEKMRARGGLVHDKEDVVNVHWASGDGSRVVFDMLEYLDQGITQLILGSVLPTGGSSNVGSLARAQVEQESTETLLDFDRRMQDEAYTDGIIGLFWRLNQPQLRAVGLVNAARPKLVSVLKRDVAPTDAVEMITKLTAAGIPLIAEQVYGVTTIFSKPGPEDELLKVNPPAMAAAGVGGGEKGGRDE